MTLADLLGTPTELEFKGKAYKLRPPTLGEQAQFQRWLESRAREAAGRAVDIPEQLQAKLLREVNDAIAVGEYEWGGEVCARALNTPLGIAKLLSIILAADAVTLPMAEEMVASELAKIVEILRSKAADDPKAEAAIRHALGSPDSPPSSPSPTRRSARHSRRSRG